MKSILENRPALAREVNKVAEVAGYLWQKDGLNVTVAISLLISRNLLTMKFTGWNR